MMAPILESKAFDRGIEGAFRFFSREQAEALANFRADDALEERFAELSEKCNEGELTEEERARFVGLETRRAWLEDGQFVVSVTYSRPLGEAVELSVFVFGYRTDRRFEQMPKLHLKVGALMQSVWDQDRALPNAGITITRQPTRVTIRIPLRTLGDPQRLVTSARTYLGDLPLDWTPWRTLELPDADQR